jgi:hypothetical protein
MPTGRCHCVRSPARKSKSDEDVGGKKTEKKTKKKMRKEGRRAANLMV